jgi:hypothetical protein
MGSNEMTKRRGAVVRVGEAQAPPRFFPGESQFSTGTARKFAYELTSKMKPFKTIFNTFYEYFKILLLLLLYLLRNHYTVLR